MPSLEDAVFARPRLYELITRLALAWNYGRIPRLVVEIVSPRAHRVLDLGAGGGYLACPMIRRGRRVVSLDAGAVQLSYNRRQCAADMVLADALRLPFRDGVFDAVVSSFAFHHLPDAVKAMTECRRMLAAGGQMALVDILAPAGWRRAAVAGVLAVEGWPRLYDELGWRRLAAQAGFRVEGFRRLHLGTLFLLEMRAER